jgi:hypothetical protein
MANSAQNLDQPLPDEIADALEAAGLPRNSTMMDIIVAFHRMKDAAAKPEEKQPLGKLLPVGLKYERARRAAERGELQAVMPNGRWLSTKSWVAGWLVRIGWSPVR